MLKKMPIHARVHLRWIISIVCQYSFKLVQSGEELVHHFKYDRVLFNISVKNKVALIAVPMFYFYLLVLVFSDVYFLELSDAILVSLIKLFLLGCIKTCSYSRTPDENKHFIILKDIPCLSYSHVPCHRSSNLSLLITPPVMSLTACQPFSNPWYKLYSWHYGRDHLSTQRAHAVLPMQTAWLVGHPLLAVWYLIDCPSFVFFSLDLCMFPLHLHSTSSSFLFV